jgi:hypothetical protein
MGWKSTALDQGEIYGIWKFTNHTRWRLSLSVIDDERSEIYGIWKFTNHTRWRLSLSVIDDERKRSINRVLALCAGC